MVTRESERTPIKEIAAEQGSGLLILDKLFKAPDAPDKVRMFAKATLAPDAEVGYHKHVGESEAYYILSGTGEYNDDGKLYTVKPGDITYTPDGHSHGIKNIGTDNLDFIALIVLD